MGEKFEWIHFSSLAFQVNRTTTHLHRHIMALFFHFLVSASSKFLSHMLQYYMQRFMIFFRENVIFFSFLQKKWLDVVYIGMRKWASILSFSQYSSWRKKIHIFSISFQKWVYSSYYFFVLLYIVRSSTQVKVTSSS